MACAVALRTEEFAIRMALGATPKENFTNALRSGTKLLLFGVLLGLSCSTALTQVLSHLFYQTTPWDPAAYLLSCLAICAAGIVCVRRPCVASREVESRQGS
jgi:putative ABC transport system permease protein